jgi:hypothetical protein
MSRVLAILTTSIAIVSMLLMGTSVHGAIFEDNFESYDISGGPIVVVGLIAPTGQVYEQSIGTNLTGNPTVPSMQVSSDAGIDSAQGVGFDGSPATSATVPLGATYSTGVYTLAIDYRISESSGGPQFFLGNADLTGNSLSVALESNQIALQGSGLGNHVVPLASWIAPADMHLELTMDLDAQSVTLKWQGLDGSNVGSFGTYSTAYPSALSFSHLILFDPVKAGPHGFDNLMLVDGLLPVPEPSAILLGGLGFIGSIVLKRRNLAPVALNRN